MVVEPGIERRKNLDEALLAVEHHHLPRRHLRREVERQFEVAEIGAHRGIDVRAEGLVALDRRLHAQRLLAGRKARRHRRVDADVGQCAAAEVELVAHVPGVDIVVGERALHMAQPADGAAGDEVAHLDPLRMVDDHEGFADQHLLLVAQLDQRGNVLGVERQRFLDQNVLARLDRLRRPFDMLRGRQRDVDAVDLLGGEQFFVGAEGVRRAEAVGQRAGLRKIAAGDRRQHAVLRLNDRRQQMLAADLGRRQNTPSEHHASPCRFTGDEVCLKSREKPMREAARPSSPHAVGRGGPAKPGRRGAFVESQP